MIRVSRISKHFQLGQSSVHALEDLSLEISDGEFLAVAGPSGSGKSTLLNLIGCIERPSTGEIWIDDVKISELSSDAGADFRARRLGFIFQSFNLLPVFTTYENVEYPLYFRELNAEARRAHVMRLLEDVGMAALADRRPAQLSGGQRQRVAIARALVGRPSIVLADEPTANLDQATAEEIISLMKRLHADHGVTVILSTHDPRVIRRADRLVRLENGRLAAGDAVPQAI